MEKEWVLVTGATDGIGLATAAGLAKKGYAVVLHGRDTKKLEAARKKLNEEQPKASLETARGDFALLDEVRDLGVELQKRFPVLKAVVHNAGVYLTERKVTHDGWEATWQINHLAPTLLTEYLLPLLGKGSPSRLVWVSSGLHRSGDIPWNDLNRERHYSGGDAYSASKLANVLTAFSFSRALKAENTGSFALHPGVISTKLLHSAFGGGGGSSTASGAVTSILLASDPSLQGQTGLYYSDGRLAPSSPKTHDIELQNELWLWTRKALGLA